MNRCIVLFLTLVLVWSTSSAQNLNIDSLKSLIPEFRGDFAKLDEIYTELAASYHAKHDTAMSFMYFDRIIKEAPDSSFICKAWRNKSKFLFELERFDEGKALGQKALALAKRKGYARNEYVVLNILGVYAIHRADYSYALKCLYSSVMIREKINQSAGLVYGNIGLVLYKLRETKKALRYFERSLSDSTQPNGDFVSLTNIALCHFHLKNFQGGEKYLRLAQPWIRNREDMANWSFSYGLGYLLTRDFKKAKVWFHKSLELARDVEDRRFEAESLVHLSSAYQGLRQYDSSLTMLGSSWPIAKTYGYNEIALDILRQFKSTYRSLGDHCMLALYNTQYIEMRERVHPLRLATEKAKTEAAFYEVALLESQKRNQRILEINNDSIQREKTLNIMIALCSALMLIMATVFVTSILIQRGFAATLNQKVKDRIDALDDNTKYLIAKSAGGRDAIAVAQELLSWKSSLTCLRNCSRSSFAKIQRHDR